MRGVHLPRRIFRKIELPFQRWRWLMDGTVYMFGIPRL